MEFILVVVLALLSYFVGVAVGQDVIKDKAEKFQRDLFESYNGDSDIERSFRNGVRYIVGKLTGKTQEYEDVANADVDEITATEIGSIYDLLVSYGYNRSTDDMIELCKELIDRLTDKDWYNKRKSTDEGDIIYGYIILLFGDYGTSPRSGWFENKHKRFAPLIVDQIRQRLQELINRKEMEES